MFIILCAQDNGHKEDITSLLGLSEEEKSRKPKEVLATILKVGQVDWIG